MLKTKHFFAITIIAIILFFYICTTCYAVVPVTEQNLKYAFEKIVTLDVKNQNSSIYSEIDNIYFSNNIINLVTGDEEKSFNYDLTGNPTFSIETVIQEGMSEDEVLARISGGNEIVFYLAGAYIQGVEFEDAFWYVSESSMPKLLGIILSNGIKTFDENNVMEYVDYLFDEKWVITDSKDFNTYNWTIEKKDLTSTSCQLVSTITINLEGNFEGIKGYVDNKIKEILDNEIGRKRKHGYCRQNKSRNKS